jgi:hypothetical protein
VFGPFASQARNSSRRNGTNSRNPTRSASPARRGTSPAAAGGLVEDDDDCVVTVYQRPYITAVVAEAEAIGERASHLFLMLERVPVLDGFLEGSALGEHDYVQPYREWLREQEAIARRAAGVVDDASEEESRRASDGDEGGPPTLTTDNITFIDAASPSRATSPGRGGTARSARSRNRVGVPSSGDTTGALSANASHTTGGVSGADGGDRTAGAAALVASADEFEAMHRGHEEQRAQQERGRAEAEQRLLWEQHPFSGAPATLVGRFQPVRQHSIAPVLPPAVLEQEARRRNDFAAHSAAVHAAVAGGDLDGVGTEPLPSASIDGLASGGFSSEFSFALGSAISGAIVPPAALRAVPTSQVVHASLNRGAGGAPPAALGAHLMGDGSLVNEVLAAATSETADAAMRQERDEATYYRTLAARPATRSLIRLPNSPLGAGVGVGMGGGAARPRQQMLLKRQQDEVLQGCRRMLSEAAGMSQQQPKATAVMPHRASSAAAAQQLAAHRRRQTFVAVENLTAACGPAAVTEPLFAVSSLISRVAAVVQNQLQLQVMLHATGSLASPLFIDESGTPGGHGNVGVGRSKSGGYSGVGPGDENGSASSARVAASARSYASGPGSEIAALLSGATTTSGTNASALNASGVGAAAALAGSNIFRGLVVAAPAAATHALLRRSGHEAIAERSMAGALSAHGGGTSTAAAYAGAGTRGPALTTLLAATDALLIQALHSARVDGAGFYFAGRTYAPSPLGLFCTLPPPVDRVVAIQRDEHARATGVTPGHDGDPFALPPPPPELARMLQRPYGGVASAATAIEDAAGGDGGVSALAVWGFIARRAQFSGFDLQPPTASANSSASLTSGSGGKTDREPALDAISLLAAIRRREQANSRAREEHAAMAGACLLLNLHVAVGGGGGLFGNTVTRAASSAVEVGSSMMMLTPAPPQQQRTNGRAGSSIDPGAAASGPAVSVTATQQRRATYVAPLASNGGVMGVRGSPSFSTGSPVGVAPGLPFPAASSQAMVEASALVPHFTTAAEARDYVEEEWQRLNEDAAADWEEFAGYGTARARTLRRQRRERARRARAENRSDDDDHHAAANSAAASINGARIGAGSGGSDVPHLIDDEDSDDEDNNGTDAPRVSDWARMNLNRAISHQQHLQTRQRQQEARARERLERQQQRLQQYQRRMSVGGTGGRPVTSPISPVGPQVAGGSAFSQQHQGLPAIAGAQPTIGGGPNASGVATIPSTVHPSVLAHVLIQVEQQRSRDAMWMSSRSRRRANGEGGVSSTRDQSSRTTGGQSATRVVASIANHLMTHGGGTAGGGGSGTNVGGGSSGARASGPAGGGSASARRSDRFTTLECLYTEGAPTASSSPSKGKRRSQSARSRTASAASSSRKKHHHHHSNGGGDFVGGYGRSGGGGPLDEDRQYNLVLQNAVDIALETIAPSHPDDHEWAAARLRGILDVVVGDAPPAQGPPELEPRPRATQGPVVASPREQVSLARRVERVRNAAPYRSPFEPTNDAALNYFGAHRTSREEASARAFKATPMHPSCAMVPRPPPGLDPAVALRLAFASPRGVNYNRVRRPDHYVAPLMGVERASTTDEFPPRPSSEVGTIEGDRRSFAATARTLPSSSSTPINRMTPTGAAPSSEGHPQAAPAPTSSTPNSTADDRATTATQTPRRPQRRGDEHLKGQPRPPRRPVWERILAPGNAHLPSPIFPSPRPQHAE